MHSSRILAQTETQTCPGFELGPLIPFLATVTYNAPQYVVNYKNSIMLCAKGLAASMSSNQSKQIIPLKIQGWVKSFTIFW